MKNVVVVVIVVIYICEHKCTTFRHNAPLESLSFRKLAFTFIEEAFQKVRNNLCSQMRSQRQIMRLSSDRINLKRQQQQQQVSLRKALLYP